MISCSTSILTLKRIIVKFGTFKYLLINAMANKSQWKCLRKRHCSGQSTLWACIDFPLYLFSDWLAHEGQWCWPLSSSDSKQRQASHRLVTGSGVWSGVWLLRVSRLTLHGYLLHDSWQDEDEECRKCQRSKGAMQEVFPLSHKLVLLSCDDKGMFFTSLITFRFSFRPFHPPHAVLYFPSRHWQIKNTL